MLKKLFIVSIFILCQLSNSSAQKGELRTYPVKLIPISGFIHIIDSLNKIFPAEREKAVTRFWEQLVSNHSIPLVIGDSVLFLYRGKAEKVSWAGDFNGWDPGDSGSKGKLAGNTGIWYMQKSFPSNARLDYKIVVDKNWIIDAANPNIQYSGFGPNSELRMPGWRYPDCTIARTDIAHGQLSKNIIFRSKKENLNYKIQFKVYLPYGYEKMKNLPVVYVTDGEEYSNPKEGSMIETLDNLLYDGKILPLIVVFIDPSNPDTVFQNRRMLEYRESMAFLNFVCSELVPKIDSNYRTSANPNQRAIMGASLGGWTAAWFGLKRPDIFRLIGIQSPAFSDEILNSFSAASTLPLKIFMSTGTIHDTEVKARKMYQILEEKNYPLKYIEVNEGHSWGNWRTLIDDLLVYFFNADIKTK